MGEKPTTSYNPRSNGIIGRTHQVLRDNLATFELSNQELPGQYPFDSFIAAAPWAIRSPPHPVLQATPGQLVFGRDMLLDIQYKANWAEIRLRKQSLIDKGVVRENKGRIQHDYGVGEEVLYTLPGITPKMGQPRGGPSIRGHIACQGQFWGRGPGPFCGVANPAHNLWGLGRGLCGTPWLGAPQLGLLFGHGLPLVLPGPKKFFPLRGAPLFLRFCRGTPNPLLRFYIQNNPY